MLELMRSSSVAPFVFGAIGAIVLCILFYELRLLRLRIGHERELKEASRKSVDQSRSTLKGQIAEQMAPVLQGFPYLPADARFLGDPIDYLVFDGRAQFGSVDGEGELEIVLLEVKQGQSKLSPIQRAIARAVQEGRVRFEICRIADDGSLSTTLWRSNRGKAQLPVPD